MSLFKKKEKKLLKNTLMEFPSASRYAESFRTLRTNLNFSSMEKGLSSVVVTSSVESEGKTNTAINLGYTIAQAGSRVLLIDADLRRPRMTGAFSCKDNVGLTDIVLNVLNARVDQGDLATYSLRDILILIKLQKRTGELEIVSSKNTMGVYFVSGRIVDLYWKNRPESKKLASILVQKELLTKSEAYMALGHQKKSVQRLGTVLFSMGLVSKEDLSKELALQTIEGVRVLSSMDQGRFKFTSLSSDEIRMPITQDVDFEQLITEYIGNGDRVNYLKLEVEKAIVPTDVENLYMLPSGKIPPNPSEILGTDETEFLMTLLKKEFDFILLDTPPVMPATDAMIMAPRCDGTLLVVKSGHTERKVVKTIVSRFQEAGLPILGIVLNQVDLTKEGYYRYYQKYYASYYGSK